MTKGMTCALGRGEVDPCGRVAKAEVRFADEPEAWYPACPGCIKDRAGNGPEAAIIETRRIGAVDKKGGR